MVKRPSGTVTTGPVSRNGWSNTPVISGTLKLQCVAQCYRNGWSSEIGIHNNIELEKKYKYVSPILTDKNKTMQILINLLQNAKDALAVADPSLAKKLSVCTRLAPDKQHVEIIIADTGLGISPENLARIFSFGFTTKPKGHGFGLHSSALLVKELGGLLQAESAGIGHGATFIMTLSLGSVSEEKSEIHEEQI